MKPLKKTIKQYMLRITGTLVIVILAVIMCIQVYAERRREYEKSLGVLIQIEQFIAENVIEEEITEGVEQSAYSNMFSLIKVNSDADYYVISQVDGAVLGTTVKDARGSFCEDIGLVWKK